MLILCSYICYELQLVMNILYLLYIVLNNLDIFISYFARIIEQVLVEHLKIYILLNSRSSPTIVQFDMQLLKQLYIINIQWL